MKIGFYMMWKKGSLNRKKGNVLGDEIYAESMCKYLRQIKGVTQAKLYTPVDLPNEKLDVMIYINNTPPLLEIASKHILYFQNAYADSVAMLQTMQQYNYDGYAFISNKLLKIHQKAGRSGIFLPFGVDTKTFCPQKKQNRYAYDVAYVGNDIKGPLRTLQYIFPAAQFNFGLFGNWKIPRTIFNLGAYLFYKPYPYQILFEKISKGKIPQEEVPSLYSSAAINLNCSLQDCVDLDVITLRTFEVLACKGFLITDAVAIAQETMGDCMIFTSGKKDLVKKISYYLKHPAERIKIAERGYKYVLKNATIQKRMQILFQYLKKVTK